MQLIHGDCLTALKNIPNNSIDSLVTDPPAGISFMGKSWDSDKGGRDEWIKWLTEVMRECHRVLKPGAHGLAWALPRTSHWTATALENAGFEIRDVVTHLFGSGFPKSLNIKKAGAGDKWDGWGTALKPASEHWILVRKPISEKTVAANVLKWGAGGININRCRVETSQLDAKAMERCNSPNSGRNKAFHSDYSFGRIPNGNMNTTQGRFPANLVLSHHDDCELSPYVYPDGSTESQCHDECPVRMLDEQTGNLGISRGGNSTHIGKAISFTTDYSNSELRGKPCGFGDYGGASRFFYCAKVSTGERGKDNKHPTVKAKKLMGYLIKLITPPEGTVLDPFMGSGSTGIAAKEYDFNFIGIEQEKEYLEIAKNRIEGSGGVQGDIFKSNDHG